MEEVKQEQPASHDGDDLMSLETDQKVPEVDISLVSKKSVNVSEQSFIYETFFTKIQESISYRDQASETDELKDYKTHQLTEVNSFQLDILHKDLFTAL